MAFPEEEEQCVQCFFWTKVAIDDCQMAPKKMIELFNFDRLFSAYI